MPVTTTIRSVRVAEIICTYRPSTMETAPVTVAVTCSAAEADGSFRTIMPTTKETRPAAIVTAARAFRVSWRLPPRSSVMCCARGSA
jgi:hypothetical protein